MKTINVIDFPGYEYLENNFNEFKNIFLNESIIAFRNANIDFKMQEKIMHLFGDNLGWYPNSSNTNPSDYQEDHHKHMTEQNIIDKNSIMLEWHQEHVAKEHNPYLSGVWNMALFNCPPDSGKTYFVDMTKYFNTFSLSDQDFLSKCKVEIKQLRWKKNKSSYYMCDETNIENNKDEPVTYDLVKNHWITGEKTIRNFFDEKESTQLYKFNNQDPTPAQIEKFKEINRFINLQVSENTDIRMQHIWKQGDLLIPDLFKLAHAVSGGFDKNQRRLEGMFGTLLPWMERRPNTL